MSVCIGDDPEPSAFPGGVGRQDTLSTCDGVVIGLPILQTIATAGSPAIGDTPTIDHVAHSPDWGHREFASFRGSTTPAYFLITSVYSFLWSERKALKASARNNRRLMSDPSFQLRFPPSEMDRWAAAYGYDGDDEIESEIRDAVKQEGSLGLDLFLKTGRWKSTRPSRHYVKNSEQLVRQVTTVAFGADTDERLRIEILTLLSGVSWPTASVFLHFGLGTYPILDFRALYSLSVDEPSQYRFDFWWAYVEYCRTLAAERGVSMRHLDRALWGYSKVNQTKLG
jgi:hypothetical protein